jgi:hypothetical protein
VEAKGVPASPYTHSAWIALSNRVRERDGHCCRNCGARANLQVHHMLPAAAECTPVLLATLGYNGNPAESVKALLVPLSGLLTLCERCHDALTNCRREERYEQAGPPVPVAVEVMKRRLAVSEPEPEPEPQAVLAEVRQLGIVVVKVMVEAPPVQAPKRTFGSPVVPRDVFDLGKQGGKDNDGC